MELLPEIYSQIIHHYIMNFFTTKLYVTKDYANVYLTCKLFKKLVIEEFYSTKVFIFYNISNHKHRRAKLQFCVFDKNILCKNHGMAIVKGVYEMPNLSDLLFINDRRSYLEYHQNRLSNNEIYNLHLYFGGTGFMGPIPTNICKYFIQLLISINN
jgi:hypothetical protein